MGNAALENQRVRKAIVEALFDLMEKNPFSDITVSDIVSSAKVARASFYRNFASKEAVIDELINEFHKKIINDSSSPAGRTETREEFIQRIEVSLNYVLQKRKYLLALHRNGFSSRLQTIADIYMEEIAGDMLYNSANKYLLYCFSGASMNMLIYWLEEGATESAHDLAVVSADFFYHFLKQSKF